MYVLLYAGILFGLAYFDVLNAADNALTNWLLFGGAFLSFVVLRFIMLKVTMPDPPPLPSAPTESTNGTLFGFFADVFTGGTGIGTTIGQIYDEETNKGRIVAHTTNLQQWASSYEQEVVAPWVGVAIVSVPDHAWVYILCRHSFVVIRVIYFSSRSNNQNQDFVMQEVILGHSD